MRLGRALGAALLGGLLGAALLILFSVVSPVLSIEFGGSPPRLVRGIYPPERDDASGLTFAWTREEMALRFPGLDRSVEWVLDLRLRASRPDPRTNPELAFYADGLPIHSQAAPVDFDHVRVTIPTRAERRRGVTVTMRTSSMFTPGATDPRALGVMVDAITLTPSGNVLPPRPAFAAVVTIGAVLGAALALMGLTAASTAGGTLVLSACAAALLVRGAGPYTNYPDTAAAVALWLCAVLVIVTAAVERLRRSPLRNTARFAAAFTMGAVLLKLLVLLHPDMPIGDAMFHAHRFQGVLGGSLYFTSIAPGGYLFPYAPGLYVFAGAFADLVTRGDADMALLRVIVLAVDAVASLALYAMVARTSGNRTAAAIAVAIYNVLPLQFSVVTTGNLTNAFAQSLSVFAFCLIAGPAARVERRWSLPVLTLVLAAAFMSHTSTFPLLWLACGTTAVLFFWRGGPALRPAATTVIVAAIVALVLAVVLYYGHFMEVYRSEFSRIGAETATAAPDAGGRGIGTRAAMVPYYLRLHYGIPALVLAAVGAWRLWQIGARDALTLTVSGWGLSCLAFLLVGVLTPVDMRYYLAAIPALATVAATGASFLWSRKGMSRSMAVALLGWVLWVGASHWWNVIG
jgi:hypothetical protein